jgi:ATP-dependent Clp protease ATP-binding subunit ClpB
VLTAQENGTVLIGEPGVGKTSIVEGLAQKRMVADGVPRRLRQARWNSTSTP